MDNRYRMDVSALEELIKKDVTRGLKPWLITASAGTTDTGAVDPLNQISELAQEHGLWLHVDAAYGGFFLLCEETRAMFQGLEKAHSIVMDPHKGLFLPYGSGAVLVQDVHWLAQSQSYEADYMQDANAGQAEYSPADLSLELSRPFRGLRMWIPLKLHGLAPFRAALTEKIWLARFFHRELESTPDWETGPDPDLSVVTFRYLPKNGNADDFNQRLINAVREDGKVVISSTQLDGKFVMRLAVLHYRTHLKQVEYLLSFLYRKVRELSS
jgi:glutamate/tyrosine decarboxylase-like PLP-dependent enzyme